MPKGFPIRAFIIALLAGSSAFAREEFEITDASRAYWAFQPVHRVDGGSIDGIIDAALEDRGLTANPPATREHLIRRAYFDLIGLAPDFAEIQRFVSDPAETEEAFAELVERLLAMPEYGERWGRHWLDVVRYAQTNGYERDDEKPNAWRYRDYVIELFNADKPYTRFITEQLAGDELRDGGDAGLIATGFYRLGVWDDEPDDKGAAEYDALDDILRTTTETFLGLTAGCARCHHHMFDPISQTDYYQLLAFFRNVRGYTKPGEATLREIAGGQALCVTEHGARARDTHMLIRGEAKRPAGKVEPRLFEVFGNRAPEITPTDKTSGRRAALAGWIASPENPLTARVMANRIWQGHFGRGIVATPNDFGKAGQPPSNVPLLDWLAAEFMGNGWSVKHMHRTIMNTAAYRRSSAPHEANEKIDPGNLQHWRANLRRLDAETLRDRILQVSGALNRKRGGASFYPALSGEVVAGASRPGRGWGWSPPQEQNRRSVYAFVKRTMVYPFFEIFDYANTEGSLGARPTTTVAPQALLMLNSEFVAEKAGRLARLALGHGDAIGEAFRLVLGREPSSDDRAMAAEFLAEQRAKHKQLASQMHFRPDFPAALFKDYCNALPAERFLRGPDQGWVVYKGRWSGEYEGILNAEIDFPPFALFQLETRDLRASGQLALDANTGRAMVLLRSRARGDDFEGYALLIEPKLGALAIRRYRGGKFEELARASAAIIPGRFAEFSVEISGDTIRFEFAGEALECADPEAIDSDGSFGISAWGGAVTLDALQFAIGDVVYPVAHIDHAQSQGAPPPDRPNEPRIVTRRDLRLPNRRAMAEFCSLLLNLNEFVYID